MFVCWVCACVRARELCAGMHARTFVCARVYVVKSGYIGLFVLYMERSGDDHVDESGYRLDN